MRRWMFLMVLSLLLGACGAKKVRVSAPVPPPSGVPPSSNPAPAPSGSLGDSDAGSVEEGLASYYAEPYHGRKTASGETFDTYNDLTAAHRTLPFNTIVRVTNKSNGLNVDVRINDRGPFVDGRVIDLSLAAARKIDMVRAGVASVQLKILKTPSTAAEAAPIGLRYAVQVAAFEDAEDAESLRQDLAKRYKNVSVQPFESEKHWYRVRVGPEDSLDQAERIAAELRKTDFKPFIVRLD